MYSTVNLIPSNQREAWSGSGYFFLFKFPEGEFPAVVTNKHVLDGATNVDLHLHVVAHGKTTHRYPIRVSTTDRRIDHPSPFLDLSILGIGDKLKELRSKQIIPALVFTRESDIENSSGLNTLSAVNDVVMPGYPIGLYDRVNNFPIFRKGITALHPVIDYQGLPKGLLDIPCHQGSSGSPVWVLNEGIFSDKASANAYSGSRRVFLGTICSTYFEDAQGTLGERDIPTRLWSSSNLQPGILNSLKSTIPSLTPSQIAATLLRTWRSRLSHKRKRTFIMKYQYPTHLAVYVKGSALLDLKPKVLERYPDLAEVCLPLPSK